MVINSPIFTASGVSSISRSSPPQTTDRAELLKRQGSNPSFIGYYIGPSNSELLNIDSQLFTLLA
jgi:hypothetical protein